MGAYILPFQGSVAAYDFRTPIGGSTYTFYVEWSYREKAWYVRITDAAGNIIITGIKLVLGAFLGRIASAQTMFKDGVIVAYDSSGNRRSAGFDDLGSRVIVQYIEVESLIARIQGSR